MTTDPQKVPAFPVYTLQLSAGAQAVTLDGAEVPFNDGDDFVAVGKTAIVAKLQRHNLSVVRVRAIDASTDNSWDMIVYATGEVLDLSEQQEADQARLERKTRRTKRLMLAGVSTLAVLTLGGITAAVVVANQPQAHAPAYIPEGVGATLPAAPPPQHALTAAWSHPVATGSTVNLISAERLLTADPDGSMTARNPETGQPVWRGAKAPENLHEVHQTTWAGQSVYAAVVGQELRLWPITMPPDTYSVSPTAIPLDAGLNARTDTGLPYIDLGDWYIRLPDGAGKLHNVMIPPGSIVLNTTAEGSITTVSANKIYTLDNNGNITAEKGFAAPEGTTRYPNRVWTLDQSHLLLAWDEGTRLMGVLDTNTGQLTATSQPRAIPSATDDLIVDKNAQSAAIGTVGVRYGTNAALVDLKSASITSVHGNTIYANTNSGPVTMDLTAPEAQMQKWNNYRAQDPAPELVTNDAVYLVATQLENTIVYRSDRTQ